MELGDKFYVEYPRIPDTAHMGEAYRLAETIIAKLNGSIRVLYQHFNGARIESSRMPRKAATEKEASFGEDMCDGLKLVLAHLRGEIELEQVWPKPIDVNAIRKQVKMSQAQFSRAYGIRKRALQEWEQGGRQPDSAARTYLTVIAKEPAVVRRVLENG